MTERTPNGLKRDRVLKCRVDDLELGEIVLACATLKLAISTYLRRAAVEMADRVNTATDDAIHDAWLMKLADTAFPLAAGEMRPEPGGRLNGA